MSESGQTVLVTGGLGAAGRWVTRRLHEAGWNVFCVDLEVPPGDPDDREIQFRAADLTDQGEAWQLVIDADPDAVVHLAAIPRVDIRSGTTTFNTNVTSTYNVLTAAGTVGARVVWTSSNSTYGQVFAEETPLPDYLPIDEEHPLRPEDPYGTSKVVGEEIGKMATRRHGVPVASLRPPLIQYPGQYRTRKLRQAFDPETADPDGGYWTYIDGRDLARAIEAALTAEFAGHEAFLVAAADNFLDRDTEAVIEAVFGSLSEESDLDGQQSVYDTSKARETLGWEPEHTWREAETEDVDAPTFGEE